MKLKLLRLRKLQLLLANPPKAVLEQKAAAIPAMGAGLEDDFDEQDSSSSEDIVETKQAESLSMIASMGVRKAVEC